MVVRRMVVRRMVVRRMVVRRMVVRRMAICPPVIHLPREGCLSWPDPRILSILPSRRELSACLAARGAIRARPHSMVVTGRGDPGA
jgi:hypothetical protein